MPRRSDGCLLFCPVSNKTIKDDEVSEEEHWKTLK